ncbi:MAG: hypothetical protein QNJ54_32210 [Prochloraceae cyanobacterium]|nr:hypothetical protein [Prochloraceae cyanobacterium]
MKLAITVDCGGSMTKIIYRLWKSSKEVITDYLRMSPEVEIVTVKQLNDYFETKGWLIDKDLRKQAYLKIESEYYVVGKMAHSLGAEDRIYELKYENALYKVAAAIGLVLEKHGVEVNKAIPTWVGVLLPWDEYTDRVRFSEVLINILAGYKFRRKTIKIKANKASVVVRPEGAGVYTSLVIEKTGQFFEEKRVGIAQFGHRNITGIYLEDGEIEKGESPKIGLTSLLDDVLIRTSGLDRQKVLDVINKAITSSRIDSQTKIEVTTKNNLSKWVNNGSVRQVKYSLGKTDTPDWSNSLAIKSLATAKNESIRELESNDLSKSIAKAVSSYREQVKKWLKKAFPANLDCLVFSGGAVKLLLPILEDYCQSYRRITTQTYHDRESGVSGVHYFCRDLEKEYPLYEEAAYSGCIELISDKELVERLRKVIKITERDIKEESLDVRFVDAYGMFELLLHTEREYQKAEAAKLKKEKKEDSQKKTSAAIAAQQQ